MYKTSAAYKEAINALTRTTKMRGEIILPDKGVISFSDSDIMAGSCGLDNDCVNGDSFELGSVYAGRFTLTLNTSIDRYRLYGGTIRPIFSILLSNGKYEDVPLGEFTIDEAVRTGKFINITAYDAMVRISENLNFDTVGTPYQLLTTACKECKLNLAQTEEEINAMSPKDEAGNVIIYTATPEKTSTLRDLIGDLSITLGGFATINREGKLEIRRFVTDEVVIPDAHRKKTSIADYKIKYTGVESTIGGKKYTAGKKGRLFKAYSPLWELGTEELKKAIVSSIWEQVQKIEYNPVTIDYDGDPSIDLGDKITLTGHNAEETGTTTICMKSNWKYRGNHNIVAVGKNPLLDKVKSKTEKDISQAETEAYLAKMKVIPYVSSAPYSINQNRTEIYKAEYNLGDPGAILFEGQIKMDVTNTGTFTVIYELNGDQMAYSPQHIVPYKGMTIFPLYFPITASIEGKNLWRVYLLSEDGATGEIAEGDFIASMIGTNVLDRGDKFSGEIYLEEAFALLKFAGLNFKQFKESVKIDIKPAKHFKIGEEWHKNTLSGEQYNELNADLVNDKKRSLHKQFEEEYLEEALSGIAIPDIYEEPPVIEEQVPMLRMGGFAAPQPMMYSAQPNSKNEISVNKDIEKAPIVEVNTSIEKAGEQITKILLTFDKKCDIITMEVFFKKPIYVTSLSLFSESKNHKLGEVLSIEELNSEVTDLKLNDIKQSGEIFSLFIKTKKQEVLPYKIKINKKEVDVNG